VFLDFPADVINAHVNEEDIVWGTPFTEAARPAADSESVSRAIAEIEGAERPLLLLGKGAAGSGAEAVARDLVDRLQIPFVPSPMGKGVVPDDHPLCVSGARSYALQHADLVLMVGARFNWIFHFGPPRA
jgi:2-hydroxyacyl-CoA lyase 1